MNVSELLLTVRQVKAVRWLVYAFAALVLIAIGAVWSPSSQHVNDARNCVRAADQMHVSATRCIDLIRKAK